MDTLLTLTTRTTVPQVKMRDPGPSEAQLGHILEAGAAAPDHGRLRPWRFLVVQGESRHRLGELFAEAALKAAPDMPAAEIEKQRSAPGRAPLIVIVVTRIVREGTKIPELEQFASAAAAAQNILLAAHAQGFAGKWSTGRNANDPLIRERLGVAAGDHIVGFLYIGSCDDVLAPQNRPPLDEIVIPWP
jgi:nitroreductase